MEQEAEILELFHKFKRNSTKQLLKMDKWEVWTLAGTLVIGDQWTTRYKDYEELKLWEQKNLEDKLVELLSMMDLNLLKIKIDLIETLDYKNSSKNQSMKKKMIAKN